MDEFTSYRFFVEGVTKRLHVINQIEKTLYAATMKKSASDRELAYHSTESKEWKNAFMDRKTAEDDISDIRRKMCDEKFNLSGYILDHFNFEVNRHWHRSIEEKVDNKLIISTLASFVNLVNLHGVSSLMPCITDIFIRALDDDDCVSNIGRFYKECDCYGASTEFIKECLKMKLNKKQFENYRKILSEIPKISVWSSAIVDHIFSGLTVVDRNVLVFLSTTGTNLEKHIQEKKFSPKEVFQRAYLLPFLSDNYISQSECEETGINNSCVKLYDFLHLIPDIKSQIVRSKMRVISAKKNSRSYAQVAQGK